MQTTHNLESPWDSVSWPPSTLWSPLCSSQGSPNGSSSPKEPSASSQDSDWDQVVWMLEKMKLDESVSFKYYPDYGIPSLESETLPKTLHREQIRGANQLSRLRQEQILSPKQKLTVYRENHGQVSHQFRTKDKGAFVGLDRVKRTPLQQSDPPHRQVRSQTLPNFSASRDTSCGGGTSNGTGVFLPRGVNSAGSIHSSRRAGKGCSTVLIPARVVQALQLHFDQIAATSEPKHAAFPPLHDVLVSNRDGMYSLQKHQSRKKPAHIQNEMVLPREWTY